MTTATSSVVTTSVIGRGRLIVLAVLAGYFLLVVALGGHDGWDTLGVPAAAPLFFDLHSITSGWECTRMGIDVLVSNPCDPGLRPPNYPRIWMAPAELGLGQESSVVIGVAMLVVFFVTALAVLPKDASAACAVALAAALCSPAVMLGVERGNVDLAMYVLVALAALRLGVRARGVVWASALVLAAAVLKLFPIFAIAMLVRRETKRSLLAAGVVLGLFAVYVVATLDDIRAIAAVVPQTDYYSYGVRLLTERLADEPRQQILWDGVIVVVVLLLAILGRRWFRSQFVGSPSEAARRELDLFWAGASIYVCTYVAFRSFDYRLVFLTLTIPQLVVWARGNRTLPRAVLALVLLTLWAEPIASSTGLEIAVLAELTLFAALVAALLGSSPSPTLGAPVPRLSLPVRRNSI